ncbi:BTAD domain-containing putative transcriptional regulator [Streptomyces sp. NPDC049577]|uniref:AfsR/SARP family transcriptional regulator n=1 Tax=Streptomyces sp. NPDC049577 TaxID=3155153 RepID=UPI003412E381
MEFQLLGPVVARNSGGPVSLAGTKIHTVLASLVLARGRMVSDSRLSWALWGLNPPATMNAQIYTYISRLRGLLGAEADLPRGQAGYALHTENPVIDLVDFERLAKDGARALKERRYTDADERLRAALALWRGTALANVTEFLAESELPRLEEARAGALEDRIETDLALGRHRQIVPELTGLVNAFPVRERLRAQLMTALYRCDRQGDALAVYHCGRKVLADELGVDPGSLLHRTYLAVLHGELDQSAEPAGRTAVLRDRPVPAMLPADNHDFCGRRRELGALLAPLDDDRAGRSRRFLITGMAGSGKSALALRAAHIARNRFPDGQLYADLSRPDGTPKDPRELLLPLLRALGDTAGDQRDDLAELVRRYRTLSSGKRLLVVLDNAVSDLQVDPLLPAGDGAAVLITSRAHLVATPGVETVVLGPLTEDEGLALLAAGAGAERVAAEQGAAREIVAHCAGLPLAVRIAAARLAARPHWPVRLLARRLADPEGRLRELTAGELSVEASLRQSLERLSPRGTVVLRGLPALGTRPFRALDAAAALGLGESAAETALEELVDARLLEMPGLDATGLPLYRCHDLVLLLAAALPQRPAGTSSVRPLPTRVRRAMTA